VESDESGVMLSLALVALPGGRIPQSHHGPSSGLFWSG